MRSWFAPHYPPATTPQDFGALVMASFRLWLASLRRVWWPALAAAILPLLPSLAWWWSTRGRFDTIDPEAWMDPGLWLPGLPGWAFIALTNLLSLWAMLVVIQHQGLLARTGGTTVRTAGPAWPQLLHALLASCSYTVLLLLALAPVWAALLLGRLAADPLFTLLYLLIGLLLAAVPLAWVSIAAAFIYPPILLDGRTALAAQRLSFDLVRGHWARSAGLVSLTTFAALGLLGAVGTLPFLLTALMASVAGGIEALMRPGWMIFGQLLGAPFSAAFLPLATAGYLVCHEDLRLRRSGSRAGI